MMCVYVRTYGTAQLQGNVYTRVTRKKLACVSRVLAKVLVIRGLRRLITIYGTDLMQVRTCEFESSACTRTQE